ncbi:type II secretion system protein [Lentisphaera marina]|uniref:type II secretion system protein n=1 Tax=Lentisphaera marina TaxID=1111041 RepID=UPI00236676FE|nr:type II secretion system protein [Lentisphaera marina]MDD7985888.1 type II secretion system protein [Lentisphaera marina]
MLYPSPFKFNKLDTLSGSNAKFMNKKAFTLLEMSVVLLIIVIVASVGVSVASPILEQSIGTQYKKNVLAMASAIVGDNSIRDYDGSAIANGYLNDMGSFPINIEDLWEAPNDSSKLYRKEEFSINGVSGHLYGGWNGPYYEAINENLLNNLILERGDYDSTSITDSNSDNDDIKLYAKGYSDSEFFEYGELNFSARTISLSGIPAAFTAKVTMVYFNDGLLQIAEQNITNSEDTSVDLPKGLCAFYAQLIIDHEILETLNSPPLSPNDGNTYLIASSGASGGFSGKENNIATWNGSTYDFASPDELDSLYDADTNKYYLYEDSSWEEKQVDGTSTARIIKTIKNDILLELE